MVCCIVVVFFLIPLLSIVCRLLSCFQGSFIIVFNAFYFIASDSQCTSGYPTGQHEISFYIVQSY